MMHVMSRVILGMLGFLLLTILSVVITGIELKKMG